MPICSRFMPEVIPSCPSSDVPGLTRIHSEGNKCNILEDGFATAITTSGQVSDVFHVAKGLACKLDVEDGECDVRGHILHINCNRIRESIVAISAHDCHEACRLWKGLLDATGHQRKLEDGGRWQRSEHMHSRRKSTSAYQAM